MLFDGIKLLFYLQIVFVIFLLKLNMKIGQKQALLTWDSYQLPRTACQPPMSFCLRKLCLQYLSKMFQDKHLAFIYLALTHILNMHPQTQPNGYQTRDLWIHETFRMHCLNLYAWPPSVPFHCTDPSLTLVLHEQLTRHLLNYSITAQLPLDCISLASIWTDSHK